VAGELNSSSGDIVLVGHMPFMSKLVAHLVAGDENIEVVTFKPGAIACVEKDEKNGWHIVWMLCPDIF